MGSATAEETYYGDRTTDAFFSWIEHEHKVIDAVGGSRKKHKNEDKHDKHDKNGMAHVHLRVKGDQGKLLGVEGCIIKGCASSSLAMRTALAFPRTHRTGRKFSVLVILTLLAVQMWRPSAYQETSMCNSRTSRSTSRTRSSMRHTPSIICRLARHCPRPHGSGLSMALALPGHCPRAPHCTLRHAFKNDTGPFAAGTWNRSLSAKAVWHTRTDNRQLNAPIIQQLSDTGVCEFVTSTFLASHI